MQVETQRVAVAIHISEKIDFKTNTIKRDKEGHFIMTKGSIQQEDMTIVNIYATNTRASRHIKQILLELTREIDSNTIIVGDFNTRFSVSDRSPRQKINKETSNLICTIEQTDLTDIWNILVKTCRIHILLLSTWIILKDSP